MPARRCANVPQNGTRGKVTIKCNLEEHGYLIIKGVITIRGTTGAVGGLLQ